MNQEATLKSSKKRLSTGGIVCLALGVIWAGLIALTYVTLEPAFDKAEDLERTRRALMERHGFQTTGELVRASLEDPKVWQEVAEQAQRRTTRSAEIGGLASQAAHWESLVMVFTFRTFVGAAGASVTAGRVGVFAPGFVELLGFLGLSIYLFARQQRAHPSSSGG